MREYHMRSVIEEQDFITVLFENIIYKAMRYKYADRSTAAELVETFKNMVQKLRLEEANFENDWTEAIKMVTYIPYSPILFSHSILVQVLIKL